MTGRAHSRHRGYSLVEVIVALAILEVGLLGAAGLVVVSMRHVALAVRSEVALTLAEGVADSLVSEGWHGPGERREDAFVISWSASEGWGEVTVRSVDGRSLVRIPVAVVAP